MEQPAAVQLNITCPDNVVRQLPVGTTPHQICSALQNPQAANKYVVAELTIDGAVVPWDMHRPLEGDCTINGFLDVENPKALPVLLHSCAHILGAALVKKYGMRLAVGPALEGSYYYEGRRPDGRFADCHIISTLVEIALSVQSLRRSFQKLRR